MSNIINNRYEFVYFFDVENGNPNGDPDAGNLPRIDPETNHGIVTDVCLKRKVRNYFQIQGKDGYDIWIKQRIPLNPLIAEACKANNLPDYKKKGEGWEKDKAKKRPQNEIEILQNWLCKKYFDIRAFGAVMSTGPNAGQIQGPVQLTFSRSIEPIVPLEPTITRVTDVDKEEGEMGRKPYIAYGLYRAEGYISANLAQKTGFSEDDLALFWEALINMFEHDHSAARGKMCARKLIIFKHFGTNGTEEEKKKQAMLGNAQAHKLFELITAKRSGDTSKPARAFSDYVINVNKPGLPKGITLEEKI
jgi:CRISPR-associated protein Csd2